MHIISDLGFSAAIEEMYTESARLSSFKNWPFNDDSNCSAAKMAEAGFYHCPTAEEPDVVQCYVCFKELDGWEPNDDPWDEHFSHSKNCMFAKLHKAQKDLTISEIYAIEAERKANKVVIPETDDVMNEFSKDTKPGSSTEDPEFMSPHNGDVQFEEFVGYIACACDSKWWIGYVISEDQMSIFGQIPLSRYIG
ncbi:baculoviral IAP repeat-containing protein 5-like [Uloborus diversus]|uniref:baculoviral IAP repeat-containing protein 5-like n=1 Tax=Uloborus diversus TaxID=327109 RepID=UPI002409DF82|nr:baculoviral IAP repeat-containing protein 5-like [Uloborus diversus]